MTTYTIKPIEWREKTAYSGNVQRGWVSNFNNKDGFRAYVDFTEIKDYGIGEKLCKTLDEAKAFIETSYKEFVEQFLEKI